MKQLIVLLLPAAFLLGCGKNQEHIGTPSRAEIHGLWPACLCDWRQRGSDLMISSELTEVLHVADRIVVMHEGRVTGEFSRQQATEETIMQAAVA